MIVFILVLFLLTIAIISPLINNSETKPSFNLNKIEIVNRDSEAHFYVDFDTEKIKNLNFIVTNPNGLMVDNESVYSRFETGVYLDIQNNLAGKYKIFAYSDNTTYFKQEKYVEPSKINVKSINDNFEQEEFPTYTIKDLVVENKGDLKEHINHICIEINNQNISRRYYGSLLGNTSEKLDLDFKFDNLQLNKEYELNISIFNTKDKVIYSETRSITSPETKLPKANLKNLKLNADINPINNYYLMNVSLDTDKKGIDLELRGPDNKILDKIYNLNNNTKNAKFNFNKITEGKYTVIAKYGGYNLSKSNKIIKNIDISYRDIDYNFSKIYEHSDSVDLIDLQVKIENTGEVPLIMEEINFKSTVSDHFSSINNDLVLEIGEEKRLKFSKLYDLNLNSSYTFELDIFGSEGRKLLKKEIDIKTPVKPIPDVNIKTFEPILASFSDYFKATFEISITGGVEFKLFGPNGYELDQENDVGKKESSVDLYIDTFIPGEYELVSYYDDKVINTYTKTFEGPNLNIMDMGYHYDSIYSGDEYTNLYFDYLLLNNTGDLPANIYEVQLKIKSLGEKDTSHPMDYIDLNEEENYSFSILTLDDLKLNSTYELDLKISNDEGDVLLQETIEITTPVEE